MLHVGAYAKPHTCQPNLLYTSKVFNALSKNMGRPGRVCDAMIVCLLVIISAVVWFECPTYIMYFAA